VDVEPKPRKRAQQQQYEATPAARTPSVDARWTPRLVVVAPADNEGADQQELLEAL